MSAAGVSDDAMTKVIADLMDAQNSPGVPWDTRADVKRTAKESITKRDLNAQAAIRKAIEAAVPDIAEQEDLFRVLYGYGIGSNISDNYPYKVTRDFVKALKEVQGANGDLDHCLAKGTITAPISHLIIKVAIHTMKNKKADALKGMEEVLHKTNLTSLLLPSAARCYPRVKSVIVGIWDKDIHPLVGNKMNQIAQLIAAEAVSLYNANRQYATQPPITKDQLKLRAYAVVAVHVRNTNVLYPHFEELRKIQNEALEEIICRNRVDPIVPPHTDDRSTKRQKTASEDNVEKLRQTVDAMSVNLQEQLGAVRQDHESEVGTIKNRLESLERQCRVYQDCFTFIYNNPELPVDATNLKNNINAAISKARELNGQPTDDGLGTDQQTALRAWRDLRWHNDAVVDVDNTTYSLKHATRGEKWFSIIQDGPWKLWEKSRRIKSPSVGGQTAGTPNRPGPSSNIGAGSPSTSGAASTATLRAGSTSQDTAAPAEDQEMHPWMAHLLNTPIN